MKKNIISMEDEGRNENFDNDDIIVIKEEDEIMENEKGKKLKKTNSENMKDPTIKQDKFNDQARIMLDKIVIEDKASFAEVQMIKHNMDIMYFFINPSSGSQEGQKIIDMGVKKVEFSDFNCTALIFNIKEPSIYSEGKVSLRQHQLEYHNSLPKVIIGGGDGSILSIIEDFSKFGINVQNCLFGVLPLGTGNDFSNALGWGATIEISSEMKNFKKIVKSLSEATSLYVDIWEIKVVTDHNDGSIIQIGKNSEKIVQKSDDGIKRTFNKSFINYFSLGYDARVGFGFEKSRTSMRCCNKCVYFWEGCKKSCCRKTLKVNGFIEAFYIDKQNELSDIFDKDKPKENAEVVFQTQVKEMKSEELRKSKTFDDKKVLDEYDQVVLKGDPVCIVCQNINYYMGGVQDIWGNCRDSLGVEIKTPMKNPNKISQKNKEDLYFRDLAHGEQSFGDGKLEFFNFESGLSLGMEKLISGMANRIYQGGGPIIIKFKDIFIKDKNDKENRVYLNIDGEYYNLMKPVELRVRSNQNFKDGKIKFLVRKKN